MRNEEGLGRVDLSGLDFVRIKCIFIAALVIRIVILRTEQVTMRKMHLNESLYYIRRTAFMMYFYCVIAYLCGITTRHKLCLVQKHHKLLQKQLRKINTP